MWINSIDPECKEPQPEHCGWYVHDSLKPTIFIEDQTPLAIQDIVEMT